MKIIDCVNMETNTCIFGYGGIHVRAVYTTIHFRGIIQPQGAGAHIWNDDHTLKNGEWEYSGNKISMSFNSIDEVDIIRSLINDIENNGGGTFTFKDITIDFTKYEQVSMDVLKSAVDFVFLQFVHLIAC